MTKKTREIAEKAMEEGLTPLEFMLNIMRDPAPKDADPKVRASYDAMRFEAAKAAAPYIHPRLQAVEVKNADGETFKVEDAGRPKLTKAEWLAVHGLAPAEGA